MQSMLFFSDNKQQSKMLTNFNIEFHENPSCGSSVVKYGNKEGHGDANSCFS
jgi:uncharacterized protein YbbK (DUF523 family)